MSALGKRVLDLAEQQGLLDGKAISELRKKVAESKFVITPEAIAKVLVDHGHLTPFQARKLVAQAQENQPDPVEKKVTQPPKPKPKPAPTEDLMLAEDAPLRRRPKPDASEEIVELEAVEQEGGAHAHSDPRQVPAPDSAGATAEDFVDLEPVEPTPAARGQRWKTDPQPLNETIEMTPLEAAGPASEVVELEPIDDLFGPDPFSAPASAASARPTKPAASAPAAQAAAPAFDIFGATPALTPAPARPQAVLTTPARRPTKNVWDSPLLLIGGGVFGVVLVAFLLLFYALTRGTAAELFAKAEDEYKSGSFTAAIAIYDQFLEKYPEDANASLARVRRGMATVRQLADGGQNPRLALETAQQVLPQIETEEKFSEARPELASLLPDIADGVTTRAMQVNEPARKQEWVKLATDALALVNNPSYLPASLRKDRENHISRIVDKLKVAERGIEQDRQLATTIEKISAAAEKGEAAEGYALRAELLRTYPGLESNPDLVAAIAKLGQRERELVKVTQGGPTPFKDDHPTPGKTILLAAHEAAASTGATPGVVLVEGAVYGFDAKTGRLLWRRQVGYESTVQPITVAAGNRNSAAIVDSRRQEVVLLDLASGQLQWRHMLGDAITGFTSSGTRLFVTTRKGRLTSIDATSGDIVSSAQLPQGAVVGPAVRQSRIFQPGEHSTLFILDSDSLNCTQTTYLAHKTGSLLIPPTAVLEYLLFIASPSDDYSLLEVLALDAKSKQWVTAGQPKRLKGRVVTPLATSGTRVAISTDLAQIAVYQLESGGKEPLRSIAGAAATESWPLTTYAELDKNRLFVAGRRRTMYEVQESLQQLALKWTENQDDRFVAPIALYGDVMVVARQRAGTPGVLLEGCNAATGQNLWTTPLAEPIAGLLETAGDHVVALTAAGKLFELTSKSVADGRANEIALPSQAGLIEESAISADGQRMAWNWPQGSQAFVYEISSRTSAKSVSLPAPAIAPVMAMAGAIIAPLADGRVAWLASESASQQTAPFLPPLVPNALPRWTRPLPAPDGRSFLISDGHETVYSVTREEGSHPQLTSKGQSKTNGSVKSLAWVGSSAIGVMQQDSSDAIVGFDAQAKPSFDAAPLAGRVTAGPYAVGGLAIVAAEPDGLLCFDAEGKLRWKQALSRGALASAPLPLPEGDVLVAYQSGDVCRLNATNGKELVCESLQEPLLGPACRSGSNIYLSGSDGVVHKLAAPRRPQQ